MATPLKATRSIVALFNHASRGGPVVSRSDRVIQLKPGSRATVAAERSTIASEEQLAESWKFRPSTLDKAIFNGVVLFNEYRLPPEFCPRDIVIDVGTHIGSFAYAVLFRGCRRLCSIEPDQENCDIAERHLRPFLEKGFVRMMRGAAWRSDLNDDQLYFDGYHEFPQSYRGMEGITNTGNGSVIWGVGQPVPKIPFDEIVDSMTNNGKERIRLLKLDCEGAEWPILLTSSRLHLIDEICGEFHEIGGEFLEISENRPRKKPVFTIEGIPRFTIEQLSRFLTHAGFAVTYRRHRRPTGAVEGLGLFFATREVSQGRPV